MTTHKTKASASKAPVKQPPAKKAPAKKAPVKQPPAKKAPAKKAPVKQPDLTMAAMTAVYLMKMATALVAVDRFIDAIRPTLPSSATDEADAVKAAVNDVLTVGRPAAKGEGAADG